MSEYEIRMKEANRLRAKKHYEAHKAEIAEKRKEKRVETNKILKQVKAQETPAKAPVIIRKTNKKITIQEAELPNTSTFIPIQERPSTRATKALTLTAPKTTEEAVRKAMEETDYYNEETTRRTNLQQIPLIFRATNNEPLMDWIKKPVEFIKAVKNLRQIGSKNKGEPYALTGIARILGAVLSIIKFMNLPITYEQDQLIYNGYKKAKLEYDLQQFKNKTELNKNEAVKRYDDILNGIDKKHTLTYLVATLYKYAPLRNDYSNMILIPNDDAVKPNENYMILPVRGKAKIIIQKHKTRKTSGNITVEFPSEVSNMIRNYVKSKKIKSGEELFGDLKNVLLEITHERNPDKQDGGTRLIRRMVASSLYDDYLYGKATVDDIYDQMKTMAHSSGTHFKDYIWGVK